MKLNKERILDNFRAMIRIRTVSEESSADEQAFAAFRALLRERYPAVFAAGESWLIGKRGVLIRIPGKTADHPSVLMAHYDVVPADASGWRFDPFSAALEGGRIYGRGTLDTKSTLCAIMEAASKLIENGARPAHDLYLSFGGEEEISGSCASEIVSFLKERGVRPDLVLDEGGSVIPEGLPGVKRRAAMIGIAEKGTANYRISVSTGRAGHASVPPKTTAVGRVARAAARIESHPFPTRLSKPTELMFRELARYVPAYEKPAFSHVKNFALPIRLLAPHLGDTFNAMVRTTCAFTNCRADSSFNVLPERAEMGVNVRLLEGDTLESAAAYLRKVIADPCVSVELIAGSDPTPVSEINCRAMDTLKRVIASVWKDAVIAPYQLNGGTDARFFTEISDHIYRFSPMVMTKEERSTVHGIDESIAVTSLLQTVIFYIRLIRQI